VTAPGEHRVFDLGAADAGDEWTVVDAGQTSGAFVVVLFDADFNLLHRAYLGSQNSAQHIVRRETPHVYIGVMTPTGGSGGQFDFRASRRGQQPVPTPRAQLVWLNFTGGQNVRVHRNGPITFDAFAGSMIDEMYASDTYAIKQSIIDVMRADYAPYDVTILTSDDGAPPEGPHSVVHFGGDEPGLLGLADMVDPYNSELSQSAVIYVTSFAPYRNMDLMPEQMGLMIGNVASHELGHLLGLYHTRDPDDVMDTTGTAWELADRQTFSRAALEASVFATGMENSPMLLEQGVGPAPGQAAAAKAVSKARVASIPDSSVLRRFSAVQTRHACGTCKRLDE
jgi:hypothetical protein